MQGLSPLKALNDLPSYNPAEGNLDFFMGKTLRQLFFTLLLLSRSLMRIMSLAEKQST